MKTTLRGIAASPGVGIGTTLVHRTVDLKDLDREIIDRGAEIARYRAAVETFCARREERAAIVAETAGADEAVILISQAEMAKDPYLNGQVEWRITSYQSAESAVDEVCGDYVRQFLSSENEVTRLRAADIRDMRDSLLRLLLGVPEADFSNIPTGTVLVAEDLPPSVMTILDPAVISGIVLVKGGRASHSAILARALEIPTVVGAVEALSWAVDGEQIIVDGVTGQAILDPTAAELRSARKKLKEYHENRENLKHFVHRATATADSFPVRLCATVGSESEGLQAQEYGCDGIGLLRSEFLYLDRANLPDEEEQFEVYRRFAQQAKDKRVVIRMLDIGGDKRMPGLSFDWENNPVLGCRAVRLFLRQEDLMRTQLRAIIRASAYGGVRLLVPMVTCLDELRRVKDIVREIQREFRAQKIPFDKNMPIGIMMETPAACWMADLFAKEADFFSIGMNDLTQYTMAVDRDNARVAYLYSYYDPAVLRSIQHIVRCGKAEGIPVCLCGQAAADPLFVPLLLGFGVDEFSVQPPSLLATRRILSLWSREDSQELLRRAMTMGTEMEVHTLLKAHERL